MSPTTRDVQQLTQAGNSQREIGRQIGRSRTRVQQIIRAERTTSEQLHETFLAAASPEYLRRHERALVDRIRTDLALLRATREEIEARHRDALAGID